MNNFYLFPRILGRFLRSMVVIAICMIGGSLSYATSPQPITPNEIAENIFIGEIYPSGHLYVQSVLEPKKSISWPHDLNIFRMNVGVGGAAVIKAEWLKKVFDEYPPAAEGMDGEDDFSHGKICGWHYPARVSGKQSTDDFFATIADNCVKDAELGLYQAKSPVNEAYKVVAGSGAVIFGGADYSVQGLPRPLTKAEASDIEKEKAKLGKYESDCTTNPSFIDSAKQLSIVRVLNTLCTLRISEYSNPGCAGHLMEIYVIDVLEKNSLKRSISVARYLGLI